MGELIAVGYWHGKGCGCEPFPIPQLLVRDGYVASLRENICRYLDSGVEFHACMGYSFCRFRCGIPDSRMGCRDLSDGHWLWPQGLSHYVRVHDVRLPDEFVRYMADSGWSCPRELSLSAEVGASFDFWFRWSTMARDAG